MENYLEVSGIPKVPSQPGTLIVDFFVQSFCIGIEALQSYHH